MFGEAGAEEFKAKNRKEPWGVHGYETILKLKATVDDEVYTIFMYDYTWHSNEEMSLLVENPQRDGEFIWPDYEGLKRVKNARYTKFDFLDY